MTTRQNKRVVVAMSGGVDSSAAALILKREGFDVIGVSMKLWEGGSGKGKCCSLEDFRDARRVAGKLGIPYYVIDMQAEFRERVIDRFVAAYIRGETPNPCILCNREMKFDILLEKARGLGADCLATGHYARIEHAGGSGEYLLKKGLDRRKDQSYFLFSMTREQLSRVLFPLGGYRKEQVRNILKEAGISIADKDESQDICFVDNGYSSFIESVLDERRIRKGRIIAENGEVLGKHMGIHRYTVGQRRGLGVSSKSRIYVKGFDADSNDVIVGGDDALMSKGLIAGDVNWLSFRRLKDDLEASVKVRYSTGEEPSTISPEGDRRVVVKFNTPQRAVTPGQAAVFYRGDELLGGGWIERTLN